MDNKKEELQEKYNEKTISTLTYQEIIDLNRQSRKGTFMDRSWRQTQNNILEDQSLTRWDKFKNGGYTFRNISERFMNNYQSKTDKSEFLHSKFS